MSRSTPKSRSCNKSQLVRLADIVFANSLLIEQGVGKRVRGRARCCLPDVFAFLLLFNESTNQSLQETIDRARHLYICHIVLLAVC